MAEPREIEERTGGSFAAPVAPSSGKITETAKMGDAHVVVAEVVPWYKRFAIWASSLLAIPEVIDAVRPIVTQLSEPHTETNWPFIFQKLGTAVALGLLAYNIRNRNVVSR